MYDPVSFSNNNYHTIINARDFMTKYEKLFNWLSSEDILEIGCANGCITKNVLYSFVKDHLQHLTGTDISHSAIEYAKKDNNIPNLSFQTLDITNAEECDNYIEKFYHIFGFYVFHIIRNQQLAFKNIFKMLKSNGQLFSSVIVSHPNFFNIITSEQRNDQSKSWYKYIKNLHDLFYDFGPKPLENVREILEEVGFLIDAIELESKTFVFKDVTKLKNTLLSANHLLNYIPEELLDDYKNEFITKILEQMRLNNDGSYEYTFDVLVFLATKP